MSNKELLDKIVGYLPYGVNAMCYEKWGEPSINEIKGMDNELVYFEDFPDFYFDCDEPETNIKLILHPISDLTKEIEVNGERFVPIEKLKDIDGEYYLSLDKDELWFEDVCNLNLFEVHRCHSVINKLLEWHFDLYDLLESGHAIDINTLKQ